MGVTSFTVETTGNPLRYNTHWSAPPVSTLAHSRAQGVRQAEGLWPRIRRVPLAISQSPYGFSQTAPFSPPKKIALAQSDSGAAAAAGQCSRV